MKRAKNNDKRAPPSFTPLRRKIIVAAIAAGNHYHTAAAAAGIAYETLTGWLERGRSGTLGGYVEFVRDVERAEAESEQLALSIIQDYAQGFVKKIKRVVSGPDGTTTTTEEIDERDWRAAAFLLERRWSNRWSLARKMHFSGVLDSRQHVIIHDDPADMARLIEAEDGVLLLEQPGGDAERIGLSHGGVADEP